MTDEQVERVARALWDSEWSTWPQGYTANRETLHIRARAAIAALPQDGLAELRALSEKATPGEWQHGIDRAHFMAPEIRKADGSFFVGTKDADAAFIVACVNHVRAKIERTKG